MVVKQKIEVVLAGGLGNQLFQLSAGVCCPDVELILNDTLTKLATCMNNRAQVAELIQESRYKISTLNPNYFRKRFINVALRFCGSNLSKGKKRFFLLMLELFGSFLFPGYSLRIERLPTPSSKIIKKTLLIGYFQTPTEVEVNQLKIFDLINGLHLQEKYAPEPIVVGLHIRGGDYRLEPKFGLLSQEYYKNSLQRFEFELKKFPLHVFTNDASYAEELLSTLEIEEVIFHLAENEDIFQSLILMSTAKNLIISNSSYAWWAAFLATCKGSKIVFPTPWFKGLASTDNLGMRTWIPEKSTFN